MKKPDWWLIILGILAMLAVFIGFVLTSKYVRPRVIGFLRQMERRKRAQLEGLGWMVGYEPDKDWLERV